MKNSNFVEGVNIIAKYIPEEAKEGNDFQAAHDQVSMVWLS